MSNLQPYGFFPTPYGVSVPVYRPADPNPQDPDAYLFTIEGTALVAGIYDKDQRARFIVDADRLGGCPAFEPYGGHKLPTVPLPRPDDPLYPKMPGKDLTPVEEWVTGALDHPNWSDRAAFLIGIIGDNMEQDGIGDEALYDLYPLTISTLLTVTLEHLGETEVDCIEAAALYAVSMHSEYFDAGLAWLEPFRSTWFRDWVADRPRYAAFARALQEPLQLPDWLCGIGGGAS